MTDDASAQPRDERIKIPLDPEEAMRALLKIEPDSEPASEAASPRSPVEMVEQQLADAEAVFARDPTEQNAQVVTGARHLVASAREYARKHPDWNRPAGT